MMITSAYNLALTDEWNSMVRRSKNGTFLFCRSFMDYHSARFEDASLVFAGRKGRLCGLLPANYDSSNKAVVSHGGLTYGGLVLDEHAVQQTVDEMLAAAVSYYLNNTDAEKMIYKPVPYIYHSYPSQEDLYALFRLDATLVQRGVSSALCPSRHPKQRQSRRGGVVRAEKNGLTVEEASDSDAKELKEFHCMLADILKRRHGVSPVHTYEEMKLLMSRFPDEIRLFVTKRDGAVIAGAWVFVTPVVAHTQYLATTDEGKALGAEDLLIDCMINNYFNDKPCFDFGISTERGGRLLNSGLIFEKEGFGARSVCYDAYEVNLKEAYDKLKELL